MPSKRPPPPVKCRSFLVQNHTSRSPWGPETGVPQQPRSPRVREARESASTCPAMGRMSFLRPETLAAQLPALAERPPPPSPPRRPPCQARSAKPPGCCRSSPALLLRPAAAAAASIQRGSLDLRIPPSQTVPGCTTSRATGEKSRPVMMDGSGTD